MLALQHLWLLSKLCNGFFCQRISSVIFTSCIHMRQVVLCFSLVQLPCHEGALHYLQNLHDLQHLNGINSVPDCVDAAVAAPLLRFVKRDCSA